MLSLALWFRLLELLFGSLNSAVYVVCWWLGGCGYVLRLGFDLY